MADLTSPLILENLQREYDWVLDVFKLDLDIHYRRAQMMLALESVLMAGLALRDWSTNHNPMPAFVLCSLGIVISWSWRMTSGNQWQFLELRRRMLRELEARMGNTVPILTIDKKVFHSQDTYSFETTGEIFPDPEGRFSTRSRKLRTMQIELAVSTAFMLLWLLFFGLAAYNYYVGGSQNSVASFPGHL